MDQLREEIALIKSLMPQQYASISVTKSDYVDHTGNTISNPPVRQEQEDPSLITGHFAENLKISGLEQKTKTWPKSMDWREDYKNFLKRAKWCNEEIYKMFFVNPPVDIKLLKHYILDLRKSTYMSDYSPNNYLSLVRQRRVLNSLGSMKDDYLTNYGCYYNRLQETPQFRNPIYEPKPKKDLSLEKFAARMRKLFVKYNATTYFDEICGPALLKAKDGIMPAGHIDRYQFRK